MKNVLFAIAISISFLTVSCDNFSTGNNNADEIVDSTATKEFVSKYDNGTIHKVARYVDGNLSGVQEVYNTKGELQNTMTYINGVKEGNSIIYFDDGSKYRVKNYINGVINGERVKYRKGGALWSTQNYKNGMPENNLKEYTEDGKLKSIPRLVVNKTFMKNGNLKAKLIVNGNYKRVKYFQGKLKGGDFFDKSAVTLLANQKRSVANVELNSINKSFNIIAQVTTQADNHLFIIKRISL